MAKEKKRKTRDIDIRIAITKALLDQGITRDCIRHEIPLDLQSSDGRADMVIILSDALVGLEIKSAVDTLDRLKGQSVQYAQRFDLLALVMDEKFHSEKALYQDYGHFRGYLSQYCRFTDGQITFHQGGWKELREAEPFRLSSARANEATYLSPMCMLSMLWREEVVALANKLGYGLHHKCGRSDTVRRIYAENSINQFRPLIRDALRGRPLNAWEKTFWANYDAAQKPVAA